MNSDYFLLFIFISVIFITAWVVVKKFAKVYEDTIFANYVIKPKTNSEKMIAILGAILAPITVFFCWLVIFAIGKFIIV